MKGHVKAFASWNEDISRLVLDDQVTFHAMLKRLEPGAGERFVVRVEREETAKKHHQLKWYFGDIVKQCCAKTGYTAIEMDTIFRVECMPPDVETLSLMTYEQMADYNVACEVLDGVSKHIDIEIVFSGKVMPGDGPASAWRGSGSMSDVSNMKGTAYGELLNPAGSTPPRMLAS